MNLDDLRSEWTARNTQLEAALHLNTRLLRESWQDQQRSKLKGTRHGMVELLAAVLLLFLLGHFALAHVGEWRFLVPALALQLWTLVMLVVGLVQRAALRKLDYGRPVLELQRELAILRRQRITTFKWAFLTGQLVWWIPFMIVGFKGLFGIDLWAVADVMPRLIAINLMASVAFIPVALWLAARHGHKIDSVGVLRRLVDSLAGSDMQQADALLERLARFEREAPAT